MSWTDEKRPWKFHIQLQTASPYSDQHGSGPIDDAGGICGCKSLRYCWGGGNTQAEAIDNLERECIKLCNGLRKDMEIQGKGISF